MCPVLPIHSAHPVHSVHSILPINSVPLVHPICQIQTKIILHSSDFTLVSYYYSTCDYILYILNKVTISYTSLTNHTYFLELFKTFTFFPRIKTEPERLSRSYVYSLYAAASVFNRMSFFTNIVKNVKVGQITIFRF